MHPNLKKKISLPRVMTAVTLLLANVIYTFCFINLNWWSKINTVLSLERSMGEANIMTVGYAWSVVMIIAFSLFGSPFFIIWYIYTTLKNGHDYADG